MLAKFLELWMSSKRSLSGNLRAYLKFALFWLHMTFRICSCSQSWIHRCLGLMSSNFDSILGKSWLSLKNTNRWFYCVECLKTMVTIQDQCFLNCEACSRHMGISLKCKIGFRISKSGLQIFQI